MIDLDGVQVYLKSNEGENEPYREFVKPGDDTNTTVRYIEAHPNETFTIVLKVPCRCSWRKEEMRVFIRYSGVELGQVLQCKHEEFANGSPQASTWEFPVCLFRENGVVKEGPFSFQEYESTRFGTRQNQNPMDELKHLGQLEILVRHGATITKGSYESRALGYLKGLSKSVEVKQLAQSEGIHHHIRPAHLSDFKSGPIMSFHAFEGLTRRFVFHHRSTKALRLLGMTEDAPAPGSDPEPVKVEGPDAPSLAMDKTPDRGTGETPEDASQEDPEDLAAMTDMSASDTTPTATTVSNGENEDQDAIIEELRRIEFMKRRLELDEKEFELKAKLRKTRESQGNSFSGSPA